MVNKDEYWVKVNRLAEYQGQRSFRARGIVRTHTHTYSTPIGLGGPLNWSVTNEVVGASITS